MRVGISPYGADRVATLELTAAAVAGGIDSLWLGDGLFRRPDFAGWRGGLESLTELAYLAGHHPGIRIGITAGNFVLAVTAGFWADELAYRRIDPADRGGEFRRRLGELRAKLAGDTLSPAPYTLDGPPVWLWKELNGGLLAHRIYAEAGTGVPDGEEVARHVVAGSAAQIADAFAAYRELGVDDLSVVLGHDDASAMRTLEVLLSDVLPALRR